MSNPFLEERLPVTVRMGAKYADQYNVEINETAGGAESRRLVNPFPCRYFDISYVMANAVLREQVAGLYHRAYQSFAGFRAKSADDYTTAAGNGAPTAFDQPLEVITAGSVYQLQKQYGAGGTPLSIGLPVRTLFKPVAGTTLVGVRNSLTGDHVLSGASVVTTTGRVTLAANKTGTITNITQAAAAVLTVGAHTFIVGDTAHVSGVAGMTEINGMRAAVTAFDATTITLSIVSSGFSAYTSGGVVNTAPQTGEEVRGGCEFDIPVRFNSRIDFEHLTIDVRQTSQIELKELINP